MQSSERQFVRGTVDYPRYVWESVSSRATAIGQSRQAHPELRTQALPHADVRIQTPAPPVGLPDEYPVPGLVAGVMDRVTVVRTTSANTAVSESVRMRDGSLRCITHACGVDGCLHVSKMGVGKGPVISIKGGLIPASEINFRTTISVSTVFPTRFFFPHISPHTLITTTIATPPPPTILTTTQTQATTTTPTMSQYTSTSATTSQETLPAYTEPLNKDIRVSEKPISSSASSITTSEQDKKSPSSRFSTLKSILTGDVHKHNPRFALERAVDANAAAYASQRQEKQAEKKASRSTSNGQRLLRAQSTFH
ncbi:hypothetical protein M8818_000825 [Zalaria obscura]|uniref:Uncharacterized protein n=1 Tax=Zalaria obscura TaxID=2024903 RepID=A0ACC3SMW7_9PEZI